MARATFSSPPAPLQGRTSSQPAPRGDLDLSPQALAFLAAERQRAAEEGRFSGEAGLSEAVRQRGGSAVSQRSGSGGLFGQGHKRKLYAYLWWWFFGMVAAHRFYVGAWQSALWQVGLIFGSAIVGAASGMGMLALPMVFGILWVLADAILIPGLVRKANADAGPDTSVFA